MSVDKVCSLRQHDLDQVLRVERGSLLSVPHRGTPRSVVATILIRLEINVNQKMDCFVAAPPRNDGLSHPAFPFVFHLQFAGADARGQGEEIGEQAIEFCGFLDHREVPGAFEEDLVGVG